MKNKERTGLPEIYKYYKNKFSKRERESSAFIDYKKFSSVIKDFNKELSRMIIEDGIEFKIPLRLGYVRIKKYKKKPQLKPDGTLDKKNMSINWEATKELWSTEYPGLNSHQLKEIPHKPLLYHLNEHTDGYGFMLYWNKKGSNAINRSVYSMVFTFSNNRHMAKVLKGNCKVDYFE